MLYKKKKRTFGNKMCNVKSGSTKFPFVKFEYNWLIENISFGFGKHASAIFSDKFSSGVGGCVWKLRLNPPDLAKNPCDKFVGLHLFLVSCDLPVVDIRFTLSILDSFNKVWRTAGTGSPGSSRFGKGGTVIGSGFGFPKILSTTELFDANKNLLKDDSLKIKCHIVHVRPVEQRSIIASIDENSNIDLHSLYKNMFQHGKFSDVVVKVESECFSVHKVVLAERSSVFDAMFCHQNFTENREGEILITDATPAVIKDFLLFMYTGKCSGLDKHALDLAGVADKYNVQDLKILCERYLVFNFSPSNVVDCLIYADMHSAPQMKADALDYIRGHILEVKWRKVPSLSSDLALDVLDAVSEPPSKRRKLTSGKKNA